MKHITKVIQSTPLFPSKSPKNWNVFCSENPVVPGWITPAVSLITAFLTQSQQEPDCIQPLIVLQIPTTLPKKQILESNFLWNGWDL